MKKQNGITLIALVITIIVLLILAGITIAMIAGQDSAPQKAVEAKNANKVGEAKDAATLLITGYIQDYYEEKYVNNTTAKSNVLEYINSKFIPSGNSTADFITKGQHKIKVDDGALTIKGLDDVEIITGTVKTDGTIQWNDATTTSGGNTSSEGTQTLPAGVEQVTTLTADDYGKEFDLGNNFEWKLLYNDEANNKIYLILADYLPISDAPDGITFDKIDRSTYLYNANKNSVDALLAEINSDAWKGMLSTELQSNDKITVKGTVDLDTLLASYNQKFTPINDYETNGGNLNPTGTLASLYVHQSGSLTKDNKVGGYFLSTLDKYGTFRFINSSNYNSSIGSGGRCDDAFAIRPVVILDSDILVYEDNGVMKIYSE